jgi:hypothetical protein
MFTQLGLLLELCKVEADQKVYQGYICRGPHKDMTTLQD